MTKAGLEALAERYQSKADRAFERYQETGIKRYDTERCNAEDLSDALRMAANAADEHAEHIHMRAMLAGFVDLARQVLEEEPIVSGSKEEKLLKGLVSYGRMNGM